MKNIRYAFPYFLFALIAMSPLSSFASFCVTSPMPTPVHSFAYQGEFTCEHREMNGDLIRTWVARYTSDYDHFYWGDLNFNYLGSKEASESCYTEYQLGTGEWWGLTEEVEWQKPPRPDQNIWSYFAEYFAADTSGYLRRNLSIGLISNENVYDRVLSAFEHPYLTTPDGACSFFPVGYGYEMAGGSKGVVLIGDSNANGQVHSFAKKQIIRNRLGPHHWRFLPIALPGQVWSQAMDSRGEWIGGNLHDELRGLMTPGNETDMDALVFNLGMNDQSHYHGYLSAVSKDPWNFLYNSTWQIASAAMQDRSRCVFVVTPHDPDLDPLTSADNEAVVSWLKYVADAHPNVHIVDWAQEVIDHGGVHGGTIDGEPAYFSNSYVYGSGVHPNTDGYTALTDMWVDALLTTTCN